MRDRALLTGLWLLAFVASLLIVESYVGRLNAQGQQILLTEDRLPTIQPLIKLYGAYLVGILGFWFAKPLPEASTDRASRIRFVLAVACTLLFNLCVLYLVAGEHRHPGGMVLADVENAVKLGAWLSLLVAPVNAYYFGMKTAAAS